MGSSRSGEDVGGGGHPDPVLVDLVGHHQAGFVHADGGAEAVVVLPDRRPLVRAGDAQVQLGIGAGAHAPPPSRVAKPWATPMAAVKASAVWKVTPWWVCWVNDIGANLSPHKGASKTPEPYWAALSFR